MASFFKDFLIESSYLPERNFQDQCDFWRSYLPQMSNHMIVFLERRLRGNVKVSFNFIQGELNG